MVFGALNLVLVAMYVLGSLAQWEQEGLEPVLHDLRELGPTLLMGMALSVPIGVLTILAGRRMLDLIAYRVAVAASIAALLPCSLTFPLGLIIGLWAVVALNREEVRQAFDRAGRAPPEFEADKKPPRDSAAPNELLRQTI
jgi:hypothetical protein